MAESGILFWKVYRFLKIEKISKMCMKNQILPFKKFRGFISSTKISKTTFLPKYLNFIQYRNQIRFGYKPSANKQSVSNLWKISELGWWIVHIIVLPLLARSRMQSTKIIDINESTPLVGSSQNSKLGSVISSDANANLERDFF